MVCKTRQRKVDAVQFDVSDGRDRWSAQNTGCGWDLLIRIPHNFRIPARNLEDTS